MHAFRKLRPHHMPNHCPRTPHQHAHSLKIPTHTNNTSACCRPQYSCVHHKVVAKPPISVKTCTATSAHCTNHTTPTTTHWADVHVHFRPSRTEPPLVGRPRRYTLCADTHSCTPSKHGCHQPFTHWVLLLKALCLRRWSVAVGQCEFE